MSKLWAGLTKVYTHIRDMLRLGASQHPDKDECDFETILDRVFAVLVVILIGGFAWHVFIMGGKSPLDRVFDWMVEADSIRVWLFLPILLTVLIYMAFHYISKKEMNCLSLLGVFAGVYALAVLGHIHYRGPHWMLFIPGVVILAWCVMAFGLSVLERLLPRKCATCGEAGSFLLTSETPKKSGDKRRYCRTHFHQSLRRSFSRYKGRFIIVERPQSHEGKRGQYLFYDPADLALDSYPESDIQAMQALIRSHLDPETLPDGVLAIKIPSDVVREIGSSDDSPLLMRDHDAIEGVHMAFPDLMLYLESALSEFDAKGREFSMNKPYKQEGIYLWHNYL